MTQSSISSILFATHPFRTRGFFGAIGDPFKRKVTYPSMTLTILARRLRFLLIRSR